jgi:hypothetical protein
VRCDAKGNVVADMTFPGRQPSICAFGKDRFAVLYDAVPGLVAANRVKAIDQDLKQQWETDTLLAAMFVDWPGMCSIPSERGFALAGSNFIPEEDKKNVRNECRFLQYDANGERVSSATMPVERDAFLSTHIACGVDHAYVAFQTKGMTPRDTRESAVFEIQLKKR